MEYQCTLTRGKKTERWIGEIRLIRHEGSTYEAEIAGRGTSFHIIVGKHCFGNYICIPNHDVGSELSYYTDRFWNKEQLSRQLKKTDATTVANGLCYIESLE